MTTASASAVKVGYIAFGGDDIRFEHTGLTVTTTGSTETETHTSFQPNAAWFLWRWAVATQDIGDLKNIPTIGWSDGTNQGACGVVTVNDSNPSNTKSYQKTDRIMVGFDPVTGAVDAAGWHRRRIWSCWRASSAARCSS